MGKPGGDPLTRVNFGMDEQLGAFGILGFLLYLPCLFIALFKKNVRIFAILFFIPFLILCGAMLYTVYGIRYIVAFVAISLPVLTISYFKGKNLLKIIIILYIVFYLAYSSLYLPGRPVIYIFSNFIKAPSVNLLQNKMRGLEYKFFGPILFSQSSAFKNAAAPYCNNGNKIGVFASYAQILYAAKYLELENNCRIDTLNILHIKNYNLSEYDALVISKDNKQLTNVINKNDIRNPFMNSYIANCAFFISDRAGSKNKNSLDSAINAVCSINVDHLKELGFRKISTYEFLDKDKNNLLYMDELEVYHRK